MQRNHLLNARGQQVIEAALADRQRLQTVSKRLLITGQQRSGAAAVVIELREVGGRRIGRRARVRGSLALGDFRGVRLLTVEDRCDVGNGARRHDERWLYRSGTLRRRAVVLLGRCRRSHAGCLPLFLAQHAGINISAADRHPAGIKRTTAARLHAFPDRRAGGLHASRDDLLVGSGKCRMEQNDRRKRACGQRRGKPEREAVDHLNPRAAHCERN